MCAASSLHLTNCSHITTPRAALRHDTTESFRPDLVSHLFRWSWVLHCDFGEKKFGKLSVLGNLTCAQESWSPRFAWWMGTVYTRSSYWLILKTSQRAFSIFGDPGAVCRVGRKGGTKVLKYGQKSPWYRLSSNYFQKYKRMTAPDWAQKMLCIIVPNRRKSFSWVLFVSSYTTATVLPHLPGSFTKLVCVQGKLLFSTFLTRNEWTTDESKKRLGCYQQDQFNLPREYSVFDSSQYIVNNRKFKMRRRRESQISNSLTREKKNFACASHFLYISLPSTARLPVKMPNKSCFVKDVIEQWQNSFSSWTWIWLIEIQLQKSSLAFDKVSELE